TPRSINSCGYFRPLGIYGASPLPRTESWLRSLRPSGPRSQVGKNRDHTRGLLVILDTPGLCGRRATPSLPRGAGASTPATELPADEWKRVSPLGEANGVL